MIKDKPGRRARGRPRHTCMNGVRLGRLRQLEKTLKLNFKQRMMQWAFFCLYNGNTWIYHPKFKYEFFARIPYLILIVVVRFLLLFALPIIRQRHCSFPVLNSAEYSHILSIRFTCLYHANCLYYTLYSFLTFCLISEFTWAI